MVKNNLCIEQERFLVDSEKSCEECPKNLTKESCTYCKFFLLYERENTNIYVTVEPNLEEFYSALEQDIGQIIDVEPSQEDLLEETLEENAETDILRTDNHEIVLEKPKKDERKIKKLSKLKRIRLEFPVISAIKRQGKKVLDLTVNKRRRINFINGIKNAFVMDLLIESSLSATRPEKDLQEKAYSDMNTTRIRKRIAKFAGIKSEHASRPLWENANALAKSIGVISLLCFLLLPRYLWSPELKFTRDFSFLNAIILWTSFFVLSFCAIFFLKLLLVRKKKAKPKILCKVSLIRSLRAFRSNLESKGLKYYKQRKSTQYFFEYMEKNECNKYKKKILKRI